jgi:hypothetical protein
MTVLIIGTWGRSYKCVTSDMTVLIIGIWGRSYKRVTSDMTVLVISTWGRSYKRMSEVTHLYDLPQVPTIKTVMS